MRKITNTGPRGVRVSEICEINTAITDGKEVLLEVKSSCDLEAVEKFWEACEYYLGIEKEGIYRIVMYFFAYDDIVVDFVKQEGIRIIVN